MKRLLISAALLLSSISANASEIANWSESFIMNSGGWVGHTPTYVTLQGSFTSHTAIHLNPGSTYNGMKISDCGLHILVESSRSEFVAALKCAGVYNGN